MNKDTKKELIKEAIKEYRQEELKDKKSKVYHNTELLMKNYNELKQHSDNAIYKLNQVFREECVKNASYYEEEVDLDYENLYINTILKSKVRTAIMVQHVDMALDILKANATEGGYSNKFDILIKIYLSKITYDELAEQYDCDSSTVRRWKNDILRKLSILLFGEGGLISQA